MGNQEYSFCVADFIGNKRGKENFKSQQIFALDFDEGITYEEVKKRTEIHNLPIALCYETFSSKNMNKFRVVFINSFEVTDVRISQIIIDALLEIFPEADRHCSDVSRIFYGGKRVIEYVEQSISLTDLGTPHLNEFVYKLLALHLDIDVDCDMRFSEVLDGEYKYWIHTYSNTKLQIIQIWFLKSELIQAVGRARLLRYDCTVKLYASIPLEQAVFE